MSSYGVGLSGFVLKRQSDIINEINAQLQATFGGNLNLGAESVLGQLVGVFSEREALLWEDLEAVYAAQFPAGAEGLAVDNILALSNLKRLGATPSVTNPTPATQSSGVVLRGLVLYGTPGTVIPAGSQVKSATVPPLSFTTDADIAISAASNGQQRVVLSNVPISGSFKLGPVGPSGSALWTPPIPYNTYWTQTQLLWNTPPSTGRAVMMWGKYPVIIDTTCNAAAIQAYAQASGGVLANVAVSGSFSFGFTLAWGAGFHPNVIASPTLVAFSQTPTAGSFTLTAGSATTIALPYNAAATAVQAALVTAGYPDVRVGLTTPVAQNLLTANVRRGTDAALGTAGLSVADMATAAYGADATAGGIARSTTQSYEGSGCIQFTGNTGRQGAVAATAVVVPSGATLTFSAYARCAAGTLSLTPAMYYPGGGTAGTPVTVNATGWTRVTQTLTLPAGTTVVQCALGLSSASTAVFYADALQLELGTTANAFVDGGGVPGYAINWGQNSTPPSSFTVNASLTGASGTVTATSPVAMQLDQGPTIVESLQALLNNLRDTGVSPSVRPFTDLAVVDGGASLATLNFGANAPLTGEPSSGAAAQPQVGVYANTLQQASAITNVATVMVATGSPAQGSGTATCTQTGPNALVAGQLSVIGTPLSGWTGVTNQLDILPGTNVETDVQAMARRNTQLSANANGPLASIIQRVAQVSGVTQSIGFQNTTAAALQLVQFDVVPTYGAFRLVLGGGATASIAASGCTSATVQAAVNAVPGYTQAVVTGGLSTGFILDFAGSQGGQAQPLMSVVNNTTPSNITCSFGRQPNSVEIVAQGGSTTDIANAIFDATPAGIATYGTPAARTTATLTAGSSVVQVAASTGILVGQTVVGAGIAAGSTVVGVSGTTVTLSAVALQSATSAVSFLWAGRVLDAFGNPLYVNFSRPVPVLFYVQVSLLTDQYRTPGVPSSGSNPQSRFRPASIAQVQSDIVTIGNATPIGGLVVGYGTGGLVGAFNEVPGIVGYSLTFDVQPNPLTANNIQLLPTQTPLFQAYSVLVSFT